MFMDLATSNFILKYIKHLIEKKNNAVKYLDSMKTIKLIDKLYASSELNRKIKINDRNYSKNLGR